MIHVRVGLVFIDDPVHFNINLRQLNLKVFIDLLTLYNVTCLLQVILLQHTRLITY